jgi:F-type H+-transporting ATPase subunit b
MPHPIFMLAAADLNRLVRDTGETFGFDVYHFFSQLISFVIVALVLKRYAYDPILKTLDERRNRIAEALANSEAIKAELARTQQARQDVLRQAHAEATRLIDEARAAAARVQEQETARAMQEAEEIIEKARGLAAQEHTRVLAELKREVGTLVVQTAARVTGKVLTLEDQHRLIQETNRRLAA